MIKLYIFLTLLFLFGCTNNSQQVNNEYIEITNDKYIKITPNISNTVQSVLNYYFVPELNTEYMLCLYGNININNTVSITEIYSPTQLISTNNYVYTKPCLLSYNKKDFLGTIHNHPNNTCIPSLFDIKQKQVSWLQLNYTYNYTKRIIEGIVCS